MDDQPHATHFMRHDGRLAKTSWGLNSRLYSLTLVAVLACSSFGLLITRPIIQPGGLQLAQADLHQFPNSLAVTTVQFLSTWLVLFLGSQIAPVIWLIYDMLVLRGRKPRYATLGTDDGRIKEKGGCNVLPTSYSQGSSRPICAVMLSNLHVILSLGMEAFRIDVCLLCRLLPLASAIALEAVSSNHVLYHTPMGIWRLSRALSLFFVLFWAMFLECDLTPMAKTIKPLLVMWLFGTLTSYDSNVWITWTTLGLIWTSAIFAAGWPVLLDRTWSYATPDLPDKEGQTLAERKRELQRSRVGTDWRVCWKFICYTSFLVTLLLLPLLWASGSVGHIWQNCHFLRSPVFHYHIAVSCASRFFWLFSSVFLAWDLSARLQRPCSFEVVLINAAVNILCIGTVLPSTAMVERIGTVGFTIGAAWLYFLIKRYSSGIRGRTQPATVRCSRAAFLCRRRVFLIGFAVSAVIFILSRRNVSDENKYSQTYLSPPRRALPNGQNGFLGMRPHVNSRIDVAKLHVYCSSPPERTTTYLGPGSRCLEYALQNSSQYLDALKVTPVPNNQISTPHGKGLELAWILPKLPFGLSSKKRRQITVKPPLSNPLTKGEFKQIPSHAPVPLCNSSIVNYHVIIHGPPRISQILFLKSFLHTQNLPCSHLTIWSASSDIHKHSTSRQRNRHLKQLGQLLRRPHFSRHVSFKIWCFPRRIPIYMNENSRDGYYDVAFQRMLQTRDEKRAGHGVVRDWQGTEWFKVPEDQQIQFFPDALLQYMRWCILHVHGGIMLEQDRILIRDLRPLLLSEGSIQMMAHIEEEVRLDDSVMIMTRNSSLTRGVLTGGINDGMMFQPTPIQRSLAEVLVENLNGSRWGREDGERLTMLHAELFDPLSGLCERLGDDQQACIGTKTRELFTASSDPLTSAQDLYPGAFAFKVYNGDHAIERNSTLELLMMEHDAFFTGTRANFYGEKWDGPEVDRYF